MSRYVVALRRLRFGIILSLAALLCGFLMGAVFGAADGELRAWMMERSMGAAAVAPVGAPSAEARVDRAWKYLQRSHLHANGMATSALILIALLPMARGSMVLKKCAAAGLGLGAAGYPAFLLLAAYRTPVLGTPHLVKESLWWIAMPTAGAYIASATCAAGMVTVWLVGPVGKAVPSRGSTIVVRARQARKVGSGSVHAL